MPAPTGSADPAKPNQGCQAPATVQQIPQPVPALASISTLCQDAKESPVISNPRCSQEPPSSQPQLEVDLDTLDSVQLLAVRTRAQKKREESRLLQDKEATAASGAVIHALGESRTADRPEPGFLPEASQPSQPAVDIPAELQPTQQVNQPPSLPSGDVEAEILPEEGEDELVIITPDPFTRQDLISQQK